MGPGEIILSSPVQREKIFDIDARLFNFEINVATPLKTEHAQFLREQILPAVQANPGATIILIGSASRSGEEANNYRLSRQRAEEVQKFLHPVNSQILDSFGRGPPSGTGPIEDKHDRAVFMYMSFPLVDIDLEFYTDNWGRGVNWDDIVGFGALPPAPLTRLNLQVTLFGVPRSLSTGKGVVVDTMPQEYVLEATGKRSSHWISRQKWSVPIAPKTAQPADLSQTIYRLSNGVSDMGFNATPGEKGFASVNRQGSSIEFDVSGSNWGDRGDAQQGVASSESLGRRDAQRLMRSGGVEPVLLATTGKNSKLRQAGCFIRSPATVFFYSGNSGSADNARCLSKDGDCWISPEELLANWSQAPAMEFLILAGPNLLAAAFINGVVMGGSASFWARLLRGRSSSGVLTAVVGYLDDAPSTGVVAEIAASMASQLAGGLSGAQYVDTWLAINAGHDASNTWNAAGMDSRGYFWIGSASPDIRDKEWWTKPFGHKPVLTGPAAIA
jgi:hypothetical protein